MEHKFSLSLQTLIMLVVFSALMMVFGITAWINYSNLKSVILSGFDKKLAAISTTAGLFIDGDEHQKLIEPRHVPAITYDTRRKYVVGIDSKRKILVRIDRQDGGALDIVPLKDVPAEFTGNVRALAYDSDADALYALGEYGMRIFEIAPETGAMKFLYRLPSSVGTIAYRSADKQLFAFGEKLMRVELARQTVTELFPLPNPVNGAVWDEQRQRFTAIQGSTGDVFNISEAEKSMVKAGNILTLVDPPAAEAPEAAAAPAADEETASSDEAVPDQWKEPEVVVLPSGGITLDPEDGQMFAVTDRLIRFSPETGKGDPYGMRMGFRNERSPEYIQYQMQMARVMEDAGLTYHYTTILPKQNQLIYVIDATQTEDHSTMGTEEEVEPEEWNRMEEVQRTGVPSQSKVKKFELWGLLKVGTAPIWNKAGEIVGLAGADVNISIINKKTRIALIEVLGLAVLGLLVAAIAAIGIARDLGAPMSQLKEGILRVAAGRYHEKITLKGPRELLNLARVFDETRQTLHDTSTTLEKDNLKFEHERRKHRLAKSLLRGVRSIPQPDSTENGSYIIGAHLGREFADSDISGWVRNGDRGILWAGRSAAGGLQAARRRSDMSLICERLLARYPHDAAKVRDRLHAMLDEEVNIIVYFDLHRGTVEAVAVPGTESPQLFLKRRERLESIMDRIGNEMKLGQGESMILSTIRETEQLTRWVDQLCELPDEENADTLSRFEGEGSDGGLLLIMHRSAENGSDRENINNLEKGARTHGLV
jgi:hypothetical protein